MTVVDPRPAPSSSSSGREPRLLYLAAGMAFTAQGIAVRSVVRGARMAGAVARPTVTVASAVLPSSTQRRIDEARRQLEATGRAGLTSSVEGLRDVIGWMAVAIANDPILEDMVEQIVDRVLPGILDKLVDEPQIQQIVRGQSRGIVEELTNETRSRAAAGDDAVERFVARLLRRRTSAE